MAAESEAMAAAGNRKESRFLVELDRYYSARQCQVSSFASAPCPQNFIPGATKAKTSVKIVQTMSRKVSSVCYRGVVVQMKEGMTATEKGLMPAGLLSMAFPSPSQHTSCLEHKIEQMLQRSSKLFNSLPTAEECQGSDDNDVGEIKDRAVLERMTSKRRGYSLPTTRRDIGTLPVTSNDDNGVAELCSFYKPKKVKRNSYPLTSDEYEAHLPQLRKFDTVDKTAVDSVARLRAFCRGVSYHGSSLLPEQLRNATNPSLRPVNENSDATIERKLNDLQENATTRSWQPQGENISELPWQTEALRKHSSNENIVSECPTESLSERRAFSDSEKQGSSSKLTNSFRKVKNLKKRLTTKKKKSSNDETGEHDVVSKANKETLSQIQNALRSKLPKTLQATVKVGLSFDPVTVKERNDRARECRNITQMLGGKERSNSLPSNSLVYTRDKRSQTLANVIAVPSLIVSPPVNESSDAVSMNSRTGRLDSFLKLGKGTLSRKVEKWSRSKKREALKCPSAPDIDLIQPLSDSHARKLENLLGDEFKAIYAKNRSRSLPLTRKANMMVTRGPSLNAKSATEIGERGELSHRVDVFSSCETSDSEASCHKTENASESEVSDYNDLEDGDEQGRSDNATTVTLANAVRELQKVYSAQHSTSSLPDHHVAIESGSTQSSVNLETNSSEAESTPRVEGSDAVTGKGRVGPLRVETMNKTKLLKTSKQLMEESKSQHSENCSLTTSPKRRRSKRYKKQSDGVKEISSIQKCDCDDLKDPSTIRDADRRENGKSSLHEKEISVTEEINSTNNYLTNGDSACDTELKELDALLMELESYTVQ